MFQISSEASRALDEGKRVFAEIDFLPDFTEEMWEKEKSRRLSEDRNCMLGTFFLGLVNRKVLDLLLRKQGIQAEKKASKVDEDTLVSIMREGDNWRNPAERDGQGSYVCLLQRPLPVRRNVRCRRNLRRLQPAVGFHQRMDRRDERGGGKEQR